MVVIRSNSEANASVALTFNGNMVNPLRDDLVTIMKKKAPDYNIGIRAIRYTDHNSCLVNGHVSFVYIHDRDSSNVSAAQEFIKSCVHEVKESHNDITVESSEITQGDTFEELSLHAKVVTLSRK